MNRLLSKLIGKTIDSLNRLAAKMERKLDELQEAKDKRDKQ